MISDLEQRRRQKRDLEIVDRLLEGAERDIKSGKLRIRDQAELKQTINIALFLLGKPKIKSEATFSNRLRNMLKAAGNGEIEDILGEL